jgi:hypothetical protein
MKFGTMGTETVSVMLTYMGKIACRIQAIYMNKFNLKVQYKQLQIPPKFEKPKVIVALASRLFVVKQNE